MELDLGLLGSSWEGLGIGSGIIGIVPWDWLWDCWDHPMGFGSRIVAEVGSWELRSHIIPASLLCRHSHFSVAIPVFPSPFPFFRRHSCFSVAIPVFPSPFPVGGGHSQVDAGKLRVVDESEGRLWAESRGFLYWETSAQSGEGIQEMFQVGILDWECGRDMFWVGIPNGNLGGRCCGLESQAGGSRWEFQVRIPGWEDMGEFYSRGFQMGISG